MSFFPKDTIPDTALLNINPVTEPEKKPEKEPPVQDPYGTDETGRQPRKNSRAGPVWNR